MRILLFGGSGQVGRAILGASGADILAPTRREVDLGDATALARAVETTDADVVINAAAYTDVDGAEREQELAWRINAIAPAHIAAACARCSVPLIHVSTDYVFDGRAGRPQNEDAPTNPVNVYGASKLAGELAVRKALQEHFIVRIASVFGPHGRNFVRTMLELFATRDEVRVVSDQISCPTPAGAIAETLLRLSVLARERGVAWGTYHYAGKPAVSWYDFARAIHDQASRHGPLRCTRIVPTTAAQLGRPAQRPDDATLNCERIGRLGISQPDWLIALAGWLDRGG